MLGFQLAQHGTEEKIRQVLDNLLGSPFRSASTSASESSILGISKHTLLEEILLQLKTQPKWQRIYMEYADQLKRNSGSKGPLPQQCSIDEEMRPIGEAPVEKLQPL